MLEELNEKFALRLDTDPVTDRSSQLATDSPDEQCHNIVLAGGSHSVRLIDHLESANLRVVDSTVPGFRITDTSIADMVADLTERIEGLDPEKTTVCIQLLDNVSFECRLPNGDRVLPRKCIDGKYHAEGELHVIGKDSLREHFMALQPIFKALKGYTCLVLTPLPRYLWNRCCSNPTHITNSERSSFASEMGRGLRDLTVNIRNMIFMRKLKGVSVLNTVEALGIVPSHSGEAMEIDRVLALWGPDPVHPTTATYRILANKIAEKIENMLHASAESDPAAVQPHSKRKPDQRDSWVDGSQGVAKRVERGRGWLRGAPPSAGRQRPWRGGHTRSGRGARFGRARRGQ
jgi:hypothetical protein